MKKIIRPFWWAIQGLYNSWRQEKHLRFHTFAAIVVVAVGVWVDLSVDEWAIVWLSIGMVFVTEIINSAIERLADMIQPDHDVRIKYIKDASAGAVLVSAIIAAGIGLMVLAPKLLAVFRVSV